MANENGTYGFTERDSRRHRHAAEGNMGIYVNPGNSVFRSALNDDIYIDKTDLISYTNSKLGKYSKYLCVSRPRRFGKSMAADMLCAYYSRGCDSRELFFGLKIEQDPSFEEHLNRHHVIRLDVQQFLGFRRQPEGFIDQIQTRVIRELRKEFPQCIELDQEEQLLMALNEVYAQTGEGFIFILDEWDCVFRMFKEMPHLQMEYLDFLRNLFKGAVYVDLVYMTGILPIKKYGEHSAVNMFEEYSMTNARELGTFFGFTQAEVRAECEKYEVSYAEMAKWYDGYLLGEEHIYNPKAVVDALLQKEFRSYWTGTETYEALKVYIERNFDGLKEAVVEMLGGGSCRINTRHFQNDMTTFKSRDDVLTLLIHLGYLTYNSHTGEVLIPNNEIADEFLNVIEDPGWEGLTESLNRSQQLLEDTWRMDGEAVAAGIEAIHSETTSLLKYNNENSLSCVLYIAYYSAQKYYAKPVAELPTGKGYADLVYLPKKDVEKPALVVELKWNASAEGAIRQIKEKHYTQWIESYTGEMLLVGINYNKETKAHGCVIEKHVKEERKSAGQYPALLTSSEI